MARRRRTPPPPVSRGAASRAATATLLPESGDRGSSPRTFSLKHADELQRLRKGVLVGSDVVLVVDDDPAFLKAIGRLLKAQGLAVEVFGSAEAFDHRIAQHALCVILDINLGGVSGFDVRRHLAGAHPSMPVIFMTANDSETLRRAAVAAGCIGYLIKPFTPASLMGAIAKARSARAAAPGSATPLL